MDEFSGFCRACLVKYDNPVEMVNYSEKNRRLFAYCTGLQIKPTDTFTVQLCKGCFMLMKMSCVFKKQARTSDKKFKTYMGLKQEADLTDFCTFLKNTDKTFRLPLNGSSTPQPKPREEDNESTCTSIRNFITDMLRPDEIPETEAKIIDEVFDEELNVLDDSLDSHWFEDTMDQDFNLDFSLSPFASPRFTYRATPHRDEPPHKYQFPEPPHKYQFPEPTHKYQFPEPALKSQFPEPAPYRPGVEPATRTPDAIDRNLQKALSKKTGEISLDDLLVSPADSNTTPDMNKDNTMDVLDNILFGKNIDTDPKPSVDDAEPNILDDFFKPQADKPNFYIEYDAAAPKDETDNKNSLEIIMKIEKDDIISDADDNKPTEPLTAKQVKLEDILHPTVETQCTKCNYKARDLRILKTHLKKKHKISILQHDKLQTQLKSGCSMCGERLTSVRALRAHMTAAHGLRVPGPRVRRTVVCEVCGKAGIDTGNYKRHLESHKKISAIYMCDYCKLEFTHKGALVQHIFSHPEMQGARKCVFAHSRKRRPCGECGALVTNLSAHAARHARRARPPLAQKHRKELHPCKVCGKTYKWFNSLSSHMIAAHSDCELPKCHICGNVFMRKENLVQHLKRNKLCSRLARGAEPEGAPAV